MSKDKFVRINLAALTRVEYSEVVRVPADATDEEISDLVAQRYDDVDGGQYTPDPEYWERSRSCYAESVEAREAPVECLSFTRVNGEWQTSSSGTQPNAAKNKGITLVVTDVASSFEWACVPDLITFTIRTEVLLKAKKVVEFLRENDLYLAVERWAANYEMYTSSKEGEEDVIQHDGQWYEPFDPEYSVDGCNLKICQSGCIIAVFPLKHTADEVWCDLGQIENLLNMRVADI